MCAFVCVCVHHIPERIREGLAPLACPLLGEGSQEQGWELLQHSERREHTHKHTCKETDQKSQLNMQILNSSLVESN